MAYLDEANPLIDFPHLHRRRFLAGAALALAPKWARAGEPHVLTAASVPWPLPDPAPPKSALGFEGVSPGPELRLRKGEPVNLRLVNRLDEPMALHWQGLRLPNAMDGAAGLTQAPLAPGASFDVSFTPPDSGTYLYRAASPAQWARGLAGVLIVAEERPPQVALEMVALIQEWPRPKPTEPALVSLNAAPAPLLTHAAPGARIRLRLVNGCASRIFAIGFEGLRPLVIAIDGQACNPFEPVRDTVPVGPGARFDVMFDVVGPARVVERGDKGPDRDLIRLELAGAAAAPLPPIAAMALNPALPAVIRLQDSIKQDLVLSVAKGTYGLKGKPPAGSGKPLFTAARGAPVTLGFGNRAAAPATFHAHGHCLRLLHDLDDGWEPYWRDSILVNPGKTHHVALIADNPGKWLIEATPCEPGGPTLTAWFEVT